MKTSHQICKILMTPKKTTDNTPYFLQINKGRYLLDGVESTIPLPKSFLEELHENIEFPLTSPNHLIS